MRVKKKAKTQAGKRPVTRTHLENVLLHHQMLSAGGKAFCEYSLERGPPYPARGANWLRANLYVSAVRLCFIEELKQEFGIG